MFVPLLTVVAGVGTLVYGGDRVVDGSAALARHAGVPSYLVGLVTGLGTTAPEIAVALIAVRRDRSGIAVGTLFGSNITDPLFSLGVGAALAGVRVGDPSAVLNSVGYMVAASAAVLALVYARERVGRYGALACLVLYVPTFLLG